MKTRSVTLMLLLTAFTAFPQGKVTFGNDSTRLFVLGPGVWPGDSQGPIQQGPFPTGVIMVASLYAGTSASSLTFQTAVALTGANWLSSGRMVNVPVILTVPGGMAQTFLIVLCTDDATFPNILNGSVTRFDFYPGDGTGSYFGTSGSFTAVPGSSITYPLLNQPTSPVNSTWPEGPIHAWGPLGPEPSSLALVSVGLATRWVRSRCIGGSLRITFALKITGGGI